MRRKEERRGEEKKEKRLISGDFIIVWFFSPRLKFSSFVYILINNSKQLRVFLSVDLCIHIDYNVIVMLGSESHFLPWLTPKFQAFHQWT